MRLKIVERFFEMEVSNVEDNTISFKMNVRDKYPTKSAGILEYFYAFDNHVEAKIQCLGDYITGSITFSDYIILNSFLKMNKGKSITDLNEDCLREILKYLSLADKVNFAASNTQLRRCIGDILYARGVCNLEELDGLTVAQLNELFKMFGERLHTIQRSLPVGLQMNMDIAKNIKQHCTKVVVINLCMTNISSNCLKLMFSCKHLPNLRELHLANCNLKDSDILILSQLSEVTILDLAGNFELTGQYLHKMVNVEELNLHYCRKIKATHFTYIFKALRELTALDVQHCRFLDTEVLITLVNNCVNLTALKLSCNPQQCMDSVQFLPALKQLGIHAEDDQYQSLVCALAEISGNELEALTLDVQCKIPPQVAAHIGRFAQLTQLTITENDSFDDACLSALARCMNLQTVRLPKCRRITNAGVMHLLRHCAKLSHVNLYGCRNITEDLIWNAIPILDERSAGVSNEKLVLSVRKTSITRAVLEDRRYAEASLLLSVQVA